MRALLRFALLVSICAALSLAALETVYRLAPFEPYRGELREYNAASDLRGRDSRPTVLLMGDSLTAGLRSYPAFLRRARPDLRVINGGIPGSCVIQANLVAPARFARFEPSVFVYQINVTNDLLNLRYPVNWGRLSVARNLYWTLAGRARSLEYLNYKLGQQLRSARYRGMPAVDGPLDDRSGRGCRFDFEAFDPGQYTERVRIYLEAEPGLYENQALVRDSRRREYERLLQGLRRLLSHCEPPRCRAFVLVVPHASQVDARYQEVLRRVGAQFEETGSLLEDEYPFLAGLREFLERSGMDHVQLLDPLPALREIERDGRHAFFLHDPHLSECGQAALGRLVLSAALR